MGAGLGFTAGGRPGDALTGGVALAGGVDALGADRGAGAAVAGPVDTLNESKTKTPASKRRRRCRDIVMEPFLYFLCS